jgi:hypothetical protein
MFDGISGITDLNSEQKLKLGLVGVPKAGKSWFALGMPGSIYHMDFDDRSESVKEYARRNNRTDIFSKTYLDDTSGAKAVQELEKDLGMFEYNKKNGKPIPETYILDSMTYLRKAAERELIKQHPDLKREIKLGTNTVKIGKGWDIVNGSKGYLEFLLARFAALGNVIAIFHELDEKDNVRSTKEEKAYTGRKTIQPQYLAELLSTFNDVFRITVKYNGDRVVQCQPNSDFMASTSMRLDKEEPADLGKMLEKHRKAIGK